MLISSGIGENRQRTLAVVLFCVIAMAGAGVYALRAPVVTGGDAAAYCLAARYDPLTDNFDNPSHGWGYPMLVKWVGRVAGDEYRAARCISILACGAFVAMAVMLAFQYLPKAHAWVCAALVATQPVVWQMGGTAMSDMTFAAMAGAVIYMLSMEEPGLFSVGAAGVLATYAVLIRGNGMVLLPVAAAVLWMNSGGKFQRLIVFLSAAALCFGAAAILFKVDGAPLKLLLRSGAGELAFATLDKTDTWLHRAEYEAQYPAYGALLAEHWRDLLRTAVKTIFHVYDWWLLPLLLVFGFWTFPGLLMSYRRPRGAWRRLVLPSLVLLATYLWSGRFQDMRHLLPVLPCLAILSVLGMQLIPRHVRIGAKRRVPWGRGAVLLLALLISLGAAGHEFLQTVRAGTNSQADIDQSDAGKWLRQNGTPPTDRVALTRLTVAYYGHVKPVDFSQVFGAPAGSLTPDEVVRLLRNKQCQWLVWIKGHSENSYPGLKWLENDPSLPGSELVFSTDNVRLWRISP